MEPVEIALSEREFARIKQRIYHVAGISLSEAKRTLVVSRLAKRVRALGLPTFEAYLDHLEANGDALAEQDFINALTTNLTRFYREDHHFAHLTEHVRGLMARPQRRAESRPRLRIWSAGCSTGQEPYTIAMCLLAALPELKRWDFRVLATDIDTSVIERAATGLYPESELKGLTPERAAQLDVIGDGTVQVPLSVRQFVSFKPLNLMAPWPMKGPFDAIFCRNVAIYFDKPTQAQLFARLGGMLTPGGYLYIGHSENVGLGGDGFRLVGKTIYQLRAAAKRDAA